MFFGRAILSHRAGRIIHTLTKTGNPSTAKRRTRPTKKTRLCGTPHLLFSPVQSDILHENSLQNAATSRFIAYQARLLYIIWSQKSTVSKNFFERPCRNLTPFFLPFLCNSSNYCVKRRENGGLGDGNGAVFGARPSRARGRAPPYARKKTEDFASDPRLVTICSQYCGTIV